jgi:hypothetical protein
MSSNTTSKMLNIKIGNKIHTEVIGSSGAASNLYSTETPGCPKVIRGFPKLLHANSGDSTITVQINPTSCLSGVS